MNKILKMLNYKTKWIDDSGYTPTYTGAFNFVNGASQSNEYTYDKNGNLTKDLNKNISSIQYNFLNLPANITYSSGKSAAYIYDANGQKLRTSYKASASATAVPTDYCGNMIYENGVLKQVLVDGGYMTVTGTPFYTYASARDVGNIAAGYIAARNGIPCQAARDAFDLYQGSREGISTVSAQLYGYIVLGYNTSAQKLLRSLRK